MEELAIDEEMVKKNVIIIIISIRKSVGPDGVYSRLLKQ